MNTVANHDIAPELLTALKTVYPNWAELDPAARAMHLEHVAERAAAGVRAWVKGRPLVRRPGHPNPIPRERPDGRQRDTVVGYRDTYIQPNGDITFEDEITNPKDHTYRKGTTP